jgi:hypothetical protein
LQYNNKVGVAAVCRIIACILHNVNLTEVWFDHEPSACVGHDAWKSEGLHVPPREVVAKGWWGVLSFLRKARTPAEAKAAADQDDAPRGKGGHASAPKIVQQAEPAPVDSRAALEKMLQDPEQKKVHLGGFFQ